jgi:Cytochrome c2
LKRACLVVFSLLVACNRQEASSPVAGNPAHGKILIAQYGCTSCHMIPGIDGARGEVGPSLDHVATRPLLTGKLPNNPQNLTMYLQNPQMAGPQNAMPNLGVKADEARDIAAYLYTLK